jgi:hypothetical protein
MCEYASAGTGTLQISGNQLDYDLCEYGSSEFVVPQKLELTLWRQMVITP